MGLSRGTTLGGYEILAPLGAGGMGEVYRAKDVRLDREVAIKVLPDLFSRDPERVARFQREAKVLASLNHPNIAAVYGFESVGAGDIPRSGSPPGAGGQSEAALHFLVMELVEGNTLAERLKTGVLPVADTLDVAKQMAEALEAAHERGIIHRDLKPANVKVTPEGKVKVLDFGLAKAMAVGTDASQTEVANSPTITADFTRPGMVMGTAAYMSPEQTRGKPLDKRTDIWSFGCVLSETLRIAAVCGESRRGSIVVITFQTPGVSVTPPILR
ncbi:MAG: serine/threonine protein kinase [Planctomycetes bacterium]|nr:serine/threonine protein kinase [Planctomycetota bacterium]